MKKDPVRHLLAVTASAAAMIVLSGCALDPQGGYRPIQRAGSPAGTMSFNEANARCWEASMNIAGFGATVAQQNVYNTCMNRNGWEDPRMPATPQPSVPGGR